VENYLSFHCFQSFLAFVLVSLFTGAKLLILSLAYLYNSNQFLLLLNAWRFWDFEPVHISILDSVGAKDDWRWWWQLELQDVQSFSQIIVATNKPTPSFLRGGCLFCHPTNSVEALKGNARVCVGIAIPIPFSQSWDLGLGISNSGIPPGLHGFWY